MPSRYTLAAVLRTVRAARGLSQERLGSALEARHLHNVEHGTSNVTLKMLEGICERLDVDVVALLAVASSYDRQETLEDYMSYLQSEIQKLRDLRVLENVPAQFDNGELVAAKAGKPPIASDKIQAVLSFKADGLTQKEIAVKLGMPVSTVHKIWHRENS